MKPANGHSDNRRNRTTSRHAGDASLSPQHYASADQQNADLLQFSAALHDVNAAEETEIATAKKPRRHRFRRTKTEFRTGPHEPKSKRRSRRSRYIADEADGDLQPLKKTSSGRPRRKPLWIFLRRVSICLAGVALLEGGIALLTAPQFAVHDVDFQGENFLPAETVQAVQASLLGQNWVRLRAGQAQRDLKSVPEVRLASITRSWSWPPKVLVRVEARQPFARVGGGNDWWVVDRDGVPFRAATADDKDLYAVTGPLFNPALGQQIDSKEWAPVVEFASMLSRDAEKGQRWNLRRVYFDRAGFASLRLTGGQNDETLVQLGEGDWEEKLQTARWALADFAQSGKHAATLNLISSNVTTWTPRAVPADNRVPAATSGASEPKPEPDQGTRDG